jgi:hypothetical protein
MKKSDIKIAAQFAEIVASLAVVVSLIFVLISIDRNTAETHSTNDNFLYQLENDRMLEVSTDSELAAIILKFGSGGNLDPVEEYRYRMWINTKFNMWDIAFNRYRSGLLPLDQWEAWNNTWEGRVPLEYPKDWWDDDRQFYNRDFAKHVDAAYSRE